MWYMLCTGNPETEYLLQPTERTDFITVFGL
ncbi:hypothetical protein F442_23146 [Phytophthora nicotianae P10297]|uniref:Uncharacterized protein n=1 Tax=Phytophthora nicotianae P10297 TaxID=1317064 RepID=W2XYH0_PHYNI|nr:hypothetical protein F442_23146 [Phytophthora nicotianae P10297]